MTTHPNITVADASLTKDDIERFYSKEHAEVWALLRKAGQASKMRPPIFEVVSIVANCENQTAQARGRRQVEPGWTELYPEEEATLNRELPDDPTLLEALSSGPLAIEGADVIETRNEGAGPLGVADLIRVMKNEHIGRPSTYASHVEAMFECMDLGWLSLDGAGRFRVTEAGRVLLDVLADPELPLFDKAYTAELEADLDAIERGEKTPAHVLRRHLGRLPGVEANIPQDALETISETDEPAWHEGEMVHRAAPISTVYLPAEIDPENVLAPTHPLRLLRTTFNTLIRDALGPAQPNRAEACRRKACRAAALGRVMGSVDREKLVERLQLDLGWRWVVGLAPSDKVWSADVFGELVSGESDFIANLVAAAGGAIGQDPRGVANMRR
ncbi:MAG: hypothetical protein IPK13_12305 [Deltaproteobacteria bacterium]|nr:hypothetical protein [Deltaproteobacteria bacterium]